MGECIAARLSLRSNIAAASPALRLNSGIIFFIIKVIFRVI